MTDRRQVPGQNETPVREQDKVMLRLPDGMRDHLKEMAGHHKRSLNAEIVARLTEYLELIHLRPLLAFSDAERGRLQAELDEAKSELQDARAANRVLKAQLPDFPADLMERINRAAVEHRRTTGEEIIQALEAAFPPPPPPPPLSDGYAIWDVYSGIAETHADLFGKGDLMTRKEFLHRGLERFRADVEAGKYAEDGLAKIEAELETLFPADEK